MILADKLIDLRKKAGWSQEELAERMEVSRQSVSKWESAQSVPDMNRILKLSELFGVTTDYLLKDDLGPEAQEGQSLPVPDTDPPRREVSMEEASAYLKYRAFAARRAALGAMLFLLAAATALLALAAVIPEPERIYQIVLAVVGGVAALGMLGFAICFTVTAGTRGARFAYLKTEPLETAYGVDGMVKDRREKQGKRFKLRLALGIVLCAVAAWAIAIIHIYSRGGDHYGAVFTERIFVLITALLLILAAIGAQLIVEAVKTRSGYRFLLQEGRYSLQSKAEREHFKKMDRYLDLAFVFVAIAAFLIWGAACGDLLHALHLIVFPIATALYYAVRALIRAVRSKD